MADTPPLRSIDWRFLLPTPAPQRIACSASAAEWAALRFVAKDVVSLDEARGDRDLVVLNDPHDVDLDRAWDALRPGGTLYVAWSRFQRRPAARLRARGFRRVEEYACWPTHASRLWLPLGASGPWRYVVDERMGRAAHSGVGKPAAGLAVRLAFPAARLASVCAVAWRPATGDPQQAAVAAGPADDRAVRSLRSPGDSEHNKVILLQFDRDAVEPTTVVKLARVAASRPALRREARALELLAMHAPGLSGVPRLQFDAPDDGAIGETLLRGRPFHAGLRLRTYPAAAHTVTDWLVALGTATRDEPSRAASVVAAVTDEFCGRFGDRIGSDVVQGVQLAMAALPPVPTVLEHRDLSPWNVLVDAAGAPAVLDWESAELAGVPGTDLTYFLAYCAFTVDGAHRPPDLIASYRRLLDPNSPTGTVASRCEGRYAAGLGLAPGAFRSLRILTWMLHSCSHAARNEETRVKAPNAWSTGETFLALVREAVVSDGRS